MQMVEKILTFLNIDPSHIGAWIEYYMYQAGLLVCFSKPDPPAPPDYAGAAREQGTANVNLAIAENRLNNPNVITPYGSQTVTWGVPGQSEATTTGGSQPATPNYNYGTWGTGLNDRGYTYGPGGPTSVNGDIGYGSVPQATVTQTLSDDQQRIFDLNEELQTGLLETGRDQLGRVEEAFSTPWDTSGAPGVTAYADMDNSNQVAEALRSRYLPEMDKREQQRMDNLLIQGHTRGGSAWDTEKSDLNKQRNDFELASIIQAENERRANNAQQHSIETSDRGRYIQEQAYDRNVPLNEANALRSGNQIQPYNYQPYQGGNIQSAPLFDATLASGNFAQQNYQNQMAGYAGMWNGLGQLGGAAIGAKWG